MKNKFSNDMISDIYGHDYFWPYVIQYDFDSILDIGTGENSKIVEFFVTSDKAVYSIDLENRNNYEHENFTFLRGDFLTYRFDQKFDAILASHVLEHIQDTGLFLNKVYDLLNDDGVFFCIVPPHKPSIVGGHVTTGWNIGLLMYNLLLCGFNVSEGRFKKNGYNIAGFVKKRPNRDLPDGLLFDSGDIEKLRTAGLWSKNYFFSQGFDGDLEECNWFESSDLVEDSKQLDFDIAKVSGHRVLFATDVKFWYQDWGSRNRIFSFVTALSGFGLDVTVIFIGQLNTLDLKKINSTLLGIEVIPTVEEVDISSLQNNLSQEDNASLEKINLVKKNIREVGKKLLKGKISPKIYQKIRSYYLKLKAYQRQSIDLTIQVNSFYDNYHYQKFIDICQIKQPEFIIVEYIWLTYLINDYAERVNQNTIKIIDTHDINYLRQKRLKNEGIYPSFVISEDEERDILNSYDAVIAIQNIEGRLLESMLPNKQVMTVGHSSTVKSFDSVSRSGWPVKIAFIGTSSNHNLPAILDFLEKVWPKLVKKYKSKVVLNIYGKICTDLEDSFYLLPKNVILNGYVANIESVYQSSDIMINPIQAGSGLKIKNVEALCYSKALLTTSVGAEGMEDGINKAFLVADSHQDAIEKIVCLIDDSKARIALADEAKRYALAHFNNKIAYKEIISFFSQSLSSLNHKVTN